jgi:hypothetical protein
MKNTSLLPVVLRSLAGAFVLLALQIWLLGPLTPGPLAACVCVYLSLLLIGQLGATTVILPLFLIPVWFMHYVPAPQLAKRGLVDYWFCRIYLEELGWESNYEWTCWALVPLTVGLILPLCIPGFLTQRQVTEGPRIGKRQLFLNSQYQMFCFMWMAACITLDALRIYNFAGPLRQPVALVLETRIVPLGTLVLLARPKPAIIAGVIGLTYELMLAASSGLFAGLFDRALPIIFLVMFRLHWSWQSLVLVIGFFVGLYVNEVEKQSILRVKLRAGELQGPVAAVVFLGELWYELVTNPDELFGMEARSNFFARMDNQFYIQNQLMIRIPNEVPHYRGKRILGVVENFLPRVLYPSKPVLLDRKEFTYLTGHPLQSGTSMGYGPSGEFYIDYGRSGMIIGMFFYGLIFGGAWRFFHKRSDENPAWWPWFCYLFGMWLTQIGAMLIMISGRTVKGALVMVVIYFLIPPVKNLLFLPSKEKDHDEDEQPAPPEGAVVHT